MKNTKSSKGSSQKKPAPKKVTPKAPEEKKISTLLYCTSDLILSGILKILDRASDIDVVNIEKSTIDSFIESIKNLRPNVVVFANSEPLPNIREICKAIIESLHNWPDAQDNKNRKYRQETGVDEF